MATERPGPSRLLTGAFLIGCGFFRDTTPYLIIVIVLLIVFFVMRPK